MPDLKLLIKYTSVIPFIVFPQVVGIENIQEDEKLDPNRNKLIKNILHE